MNRKFLSEIKKYEYLKGYSITDDGRVWSHMKRHDKEWIILKEPYREIKPGMNRKGYLQVRLSHCNKKISLRIHRLVAMAFIDNPENKPQVNHIDGDKNNNKVENLEWVTNTENHKHKCANGLNVSLKGDEHYTHKKYKCSGDHHVSKKVIQMDIEGNFIAKYDSITDAAKAVNMDNSSISKVVNGHFENAGGFRWKFLNEGSTTIENKV